MNKKEIVSLIMIVFGGIFSAIGLYHGFDLTGLTLLENALLSVFTGCIFALPTCLISVFFSKDAYNKVDNKISDIYSILKEMDNLIESNSTDDIIKRTKRINKIINQVNDIRNDNFLVTYIELEDVTLNLTKLSQEIMGKATIDLNNVQELVNNSRKSVEKYLNLEDFK